MHVIGTSETPSTASGTGSGARKENCPAESGRVSFSADGNSQADNLKPRRTDGIPRPLGAGLPACFVTIDEVVTYENYLEALRIVGSKPWKASGVDHWSVKDSCDWVMRHSGRIKRSIRKGEYAFSDCRKVRISKRDGGTRTLSLPTVKDRIVLTMIKLAIEAKLDKSFLPQSHGYRKGRSPYTAAADVKERIAEGYTWATDLDIKGYFDNVDHGVLDGLVDEVFADKALRKLIKASYRMGNEGETRTKGIPQGSPLSPLLCNLYLHRLDSTLANRGVRFVRYADNIVLLSRSRRAANRQKHRVAALLWNLRNLEVNPVKTRVCETDELFYLGFSFIDGRTGVAPEALESMLSTLRKRLRHEGQEAVAPFLIGWINYFKQVDRRKEDVSLAINRMVAIVTSQGTKRPHGWSKRPVGQAGQPPRRPGTVAPSATAPGPARGVASMSVFS